MSELTEKITRYSQYQNTDNCGSWVFFAFRKIELQPVLQGLCTGISINDFMHNLLYSVVCPGLLSENSQKLYNLDCQFPLELQKRGAR